MPHYYNADMISKHHNEDAAAGIFTFTLLFLLCGVLFLMIGFGTDKVTMLASNLYTGVGESQLRFETVNWMLVVFRAEPVIMLVLMGINYWVSELRVNSGMADTGTMIIASAEMITMSFIILIFTLYGGYAIDTLVVFINKFPIANPDTSLFAAVQYIEPSFFGLMFLILVGIICQYAMTCVRTIDYATYNTTY